MLHRLAARFSSSTATHAVTTPRANRHDPALEQRRAARLARESLRAKQSEAATRGIAKNRHSPNSDMMEATAAVLSGPPKPKDHNKTRPRKPSRRDQTRSSQSHRGTETSRISKPGAAEAILAFSQRGVAKTVQSSGKDGEHTVDPPQFTTPEPISSNLAASLDTVPNLVSSLPLLPAAQKLRKTSARWVKAVYGGDYSQYQLDTQHYLKGARGPRSTYAKIILQRNPTISLGSQQQLIHVIRTVTRELTATPSA